MKSQRMMTIRSIRSKWSSPRSTTLLQQIATDPRVWALTSALAAAGGRALSRWLTRFDLRNRTVLITGGTRGLGLELARQAGLAGARVAICGRDSDTRDRAHETLAGTGADVLALTCDVSDRHQAPVIAVQRVPQHQIHQYGVIKARQVENRVYEILDLVEKPKAQDAPSDLAIIGRYVLPPETFELLAGTKADSRGEIQLTDALRALRTRRPMYAIEFEGRRYDTGDKLGFLKATVEFALSRPDLATDFRTYLKSLNL